MLAYAAVESRPLVRRQFVAGERENAILHHAEQNEQRTPAEDVEMHPERRQPSFNLLCVRERETHACDEDEKREYRVVERKAVPRNVVELAFEPPVLSAGEQHAEPPHGLFKADDPYHVEPAQGVKRFKSFHLHMPFPSVLFSPCLRPPRHHLLYVL